VLAPGADADVVVWDPLANCPVRDGEVADGSDYTPYAGRVLVGRPRHVLVGGAHVVDEGVLVDDAPRGRFLVRPRRDRGVGHVDRALAAAGGRR
jgi:dihydropyrimidinase